MFLVFYETWFCERKQTLTASKKKMRSQFCVHKDPLGSTGKEGRQNFVFTVTHFHHSKKLILIIRLLKTTFAFTLMSKVDCDRHQYRLYPTVQSVQLCWCASAWPVLLGRCSSNVRFCGKKGNRYCGLNELKDLVLSLGQRTQCVVPLVKRYCACPDGFSFLKVFKTRTHSSACSTVY